MAAFGIRPKVGGLSEMLMSHPPLEQRIEALRRA
jgi:Zn-dependent protease with chaperone function